NSNLRGRVGSTWGTAQEQRAPRAYTERLERRSVQATNTPDRTTTQTREQTETIRTELPLALDQTRATVAFDLDHRQKGLLWYSTYAVSFAASYRFRN